MTEEKRCRCNMSRCKSDIYQPVFLMQGKHSALSHIQRQRVLKMVNHSLNVGEVKTKKAEQSPGRRAHLGTTKGRH